MSIILYPNVFALHYFTLTMTGIATIITIGFQKPFKSKLRNFAEVLEEVTIILIMYQILCFTDWMTNLVVRQYLGYSVTVCILLHLFFFIVFSLWVTIRAKINYMKRKKILKKARRLANK